VEGFRPVAPPDIEVTRFEEGEPLTFTATVEVSPHLELPNYRGIEVERASTDATEEEIREQLDRLRGRHGTLEPVARNAATGDHVLIDLSAYQHANKIEGASAHDLLYEVGAGTFVPELDAELEGSRAGDILKLNATLPERFGPPYAGQEVSFSVLVKEVHAKRLPPLDDDFARAVSEFDTLAELEEELRMRIEAFKRLEAEVQVRNRVLDELLDMIEVPLPETLVERETRSQLRSFFRDLERHGMKLEDYLGARNLKEDDLVTAYRKLAERTVASDLALSAVAEAEGMEVGQGEIEREVEQYATRAGRPVEEILDELEQSGRVHALSDDILRRKALDFLVKHARFIDE
ncbi:MAG: trigger factor, partial [Candidatus Methylomirabilales bacterium]